VVVLFGSNCVVLLLRLRLRLLSFAHQEVETNESDSDDEGEGEGEQGLHPHRTDGDGRLSELGKNDRVGKHMIKRLVTSNIEEEEDGVEADATAAAALAAAAEAAAATAAAAAAAAAADETNAEAAAAAKAAAKAAADAAASHAKHLSDEVLIATAASASKKTKMKKKHKKKGRKMKEDDFGELVGEIVATFQNNGNPQRIRSQYKEADAMGLLIAPLPPAFYQAHVEASANWIDNNLDKWHAIEDLAEDSSFVAKCRWFKAIMTVQTKTTLQLLERDVFALNEAEESLEADENELQKRRRIAKHKAKQRAERDAARAKAAQAELERLANASKDRAQAGANATAAKHEEAERIRAEKKKAKLDALAAKKAAKLAKTQKWMDQQSAAKQRTEDAAAAAIEANQRELRKAEQKRLDGIRQGYDREETLAREKREKDMSSKISRSNSTNVNRANSDNRPTTREGSNGNKPARKKMPRKSMLDVNVVAGFNRYGLEDDDDDDDFKVEFDPEFLKDKSGTLKKGEKETGATEDQPDQFELTEKEMKAEAVIALPKPAMNTYSDLFGWLDKKGEGGVGDYMELHDDYYDEEDEEGFDEEEVQFTLQALKKMPKLRSVPKHLLAEGDALLNKGRHGNIGKTNSVNNFAQGADISNGTMDYLLSNCTISDAKLRRYVVATLSVGRRFEILSSAEGGLKLFFRWRRFGSKYGLEVHTTILPSYLRRVPISTDC
jgi:hypothetical protein